jgi:hypothetical protein
MMRKGLIVTLLSLLLFQTPAKAGEPGGWFFEHFRLGAEWGYSQCFWMLRDYNIISSEGYRIYEKSQGIYLQPNGLVLGSLVYPLSEGFELALCGGYIGAGRDNRLFPLMLRLCWFPSLADEDGFFTRLQGGAAFHTPASGGFSKMAWLVSAGEGYRLQLGAGLDLDLTVNFRFLSDHPHIPNPEGPGNVPERNIRKNLAEYCALDFSIGFCF